MTKTARIHKRLILLIAFSIIWIFIGSLVIFHQEHVMGKIQKWHNIAFVVPKSKEKSAVYTSSDDLNDHCPDVFPDLFKDPSSDSVIASSCQLLTLPWEVAFNRTLDAHSFGLRAPPLA